MKPFKQFIPALKSLTMAALAAIVSVNASAQSDWPKAKPVTLVVAFAPGASTDIVARSLTQKLSEITGGNFIVENKGNQKSETFSAFVVIAEFFCRNLLRDETFREIIAPILIAALKCLISNLPKKTKK